MSELAAATVDTVRAAWRAMAGAPDGFSTLAVIAPEPLLQRIAPQGWIGSVSLGDRTVVTVPPEHLARVQAALSDTHLATVTDPGVAEALLGPLTESLGPAMLGFADAASFVAPLTTTMVEVRAVRDPDLIAFLEGCDPEDTSESSIEAATSAVHVVVEGTDVLAASSYSRWPGGLAHIGVLTHPAHRGKGLATAVAAAAITHALEQGLVVQWRARLGNHPSCALAARLGAVPLGRQFSFKPAFFQP